jgi:hypothetical protein
LPVLLDAVLQAVLLPEAVPELDTRLSRMDPNHFAHHPKVKWLQTELTQF